MIPVPAASAPWYFRTVSIVTTPTSWAFVAAVPVDVPAVEVRLPKLPDPCRPGANVVPPDVVPPETVPPEEARLSVVTTCAAVAMPVAADASNRAPTALTMTIERLRHFFLGTADGTAAWASNPSSLIAPASGLDSFVSMISSLRATVSVAHGSSTDLVAIRKLCESRTPPSKWMNARSERGRRSVDQTDRSGWAAAGRVRSRKDGSAAGPARAWEVPPRPGHATTAIRRRLAWARAVPSRPTSPVLRRGTRRSR